MALRRSAMNEVLRSILSDGHVTTANGTTRPLTSAISPEERNFLQQVIRNARPQVSLEVGCAYGISRLYICAALRSLMLPNILSWIRISILFGKGLGLLILREPVILTSSISMRYLLINT